MDFDSLTRRDLQFFCKKNKIPANMTNIAMADALKALEIVEGIEEFMNQSESTRDLSPTSVAKNLPSAARTAARTTRRKTKDETQPSELVTRSCLVTSKSLAGEMEQENRNTNVDPALPPSRRRAAVASVAMNLEESKTPAVRSTRRGAQAAASESVQRVYSTRRSVKLLEESMADLSLKTRESLNVPSKMNEDAESEEGSKLEETQESEAISVRDLNDSWDDSKNDPDVDVLYGDLGDITFVDATTSKEQMNGTESNTAPASESSVLVEDQETSEEDGFVVVDHPASTTICSKESESEEMKNGSESESEDDGVADSNQEAFGCKVSASDNVTKVDTVPTVMTVMLAEESEESCESDELMDDDESEVAIVSDKKTRASRPQESDSDEWSDYEISEIDEKSLITGEMIDSESEEAPASVLAGKETNTSLNLVEDKNTKNKEDVEEEEMVLESNGEREAEAETKKKKNTIDEESLKDISMRQLTKLVKELAIKNKQQHKSLE